MRSPLVWCAVATVLCCASTRVAMAQDTPRVVTVLALDADASLEPLSERYYGTLRAQVELHRALLLNDVPQQRLEDLLGVMGCVELDRECSLMIRDVVGSDVIAFGQLRRVDEGISLRLVLWDLSEGRELRARSFVVPSTSTLLDEHPRALTRSILYDDQASLVVDVLPVGAAVYVDGELAGVSPVQLDDLPLGPIEVRIEADNHHARTDTVVLDLGDTTVDWHLQGVRPSSTAPRGPALSGRAAPWVLIGTGAVMVGTGIGVGMAERNTQDEFDALVSSSVFDVAEAEDLRSTGRRQAALSTALLASGGVAIGAGALIAALRSGPETATTTGPRRWAFTPSASRRGAALDLEFRF